MHSFIPPHRFFPYLTWKEILSIPDKENTVIIQPIGAIEQHGLHLPLIVDSAISVAVIGKALSKLDASIPAFALPPLYYGKSNEHCHFVGTITLSAQTLLATLIEVAESVYRAGFRKLVFMNSHGGQPQVMEIATRELHVKHEDFLIFSIFTWEVPSITGELLTPKEKLLGFHGGDAETSLMLSVLPDSVKMEEAVAEYPNLPEDSMLFLRGKMLFSWVTKDLSKTGVLGDPTTATREKGDRILESLSDSWVQVIQDIHTFSLPVKNEVQ